MADVPDLPDLDGKTPKEMRRAWLRFMADRDFSFPGLAYQQAEFVRLSIEALIFNLDSPAEIWARKVLEQQLDAFRASWRAEKL